MNKMMMLVAVVAVLGGPAAQSTGKENRVAQPEPFAHERDPPGGVVVGKC